MQRRWWFSLVGVLVICLLAGGLWLLRDAWQSQEPLPAAPLTALELDAPAEVAAGEPLTVTVSAEPPLSGVSILLAAQGTSGLYAESLPLQAGAAVFTLPAKWSQAAGVVTLRAVSSDITGSRTITIEPGAAVNPLFAATGPASVPIDSGDTPMLVALPLDGFGNPVQTGAAVIVRSQPPSAGAGGRPAELVRVLTRDLLAVARLATQSVAGLLTAAAASDEAHSLVQSVRITPADVQRVAVEAAPQSAPAGGAAGVRVQTGPLADAYANLLPDGVAVFFVAESSDGSRRWLPAVTVSGRAGVTLVAPPAAATVTVRAIVGPVVSEPLTVTFIAPAEAAPFALSAVVQGEYVTLRAGPLLAPLGALVADGATVMFTLTGLDGQSSQSRTHTAVTQYGFAEALVYISDLPPGSYQVTAAAEQPGVGQAETTFSVPEVKP